MRVNPSHAGDVSFVAGMVTDPSFDNIVWSYDVRLRIVRCVMTSRQRSPDKRERAVLELCARVNRQLRDVAMDYVFEERAVLFRCAADLAWAPLPFILERTTMRVFKSGTRYACAIADVLRGVAPEAALGRTDGAADGRLNSKS